MAGSRTLSLIGPRAERLANSRGLTLQRFATEAGDLLLTLNDIHPFRDGNGRTQRIFLAEIAIAAGHPLDFSVITKERMIRASIAGHEQNDPTSMRRLMLDALDPQRVAMLAKAIRFLDRSGLRNRNERYIATLHDTKPIALVFAGLAGDDFMARTGEEILIGRIQDLPAPRPKMGETFQASFTGPSIADDADLPDEGGPNVDAQRPKRAKRERRKRTD